jgi:hypothetical protein
MNLATYNRRLAKVAVQCSTDTFVVNHPGSYRDGKNRHLRQAPKRYMKGYTTAA